MPSSPSPDVAQRVLISGAGAAGQSVAYWLQQYGFDVTVVERAPQPRKGGFAIDLRGAAVTAAERMGILDACREVRVDMREIVRFGPDGTLVWKTDGNWGAGITGDVELLRDDLTDILQEQACAGVEYIFGDSITAIDEFDGGVDATFASGTVRRFDLVIGADGLHSTVRSLAFGPETQFAKPLGFYVGIFTIPNLLDLDRQWLMYSLPGKMVSVINYGPGKHTRALFIFASPPVEYDRRDAEQQKALIAHAFADDHGWEVDRLRQALPDATDLYFDDVTQIHMRSWSKGRVALLGDAAYAPTLITGQGSSLAVVGAYVLAGELHAADGDHALAFSRYEEAMRPYVERNQRIAIDCPELAFPLTAEELDDRNAAMRAYGDASDGPLPDDSAAVMIQGAANAITLKTYEHA